MPHRLGVHFTSLLLPTNFEYWFTVSAQAKWKRLNRKEDPASSERHTGLTHEKFKAIYFYLTPVTQPSINPWRDRINYNGNDTKYFKVFLIVHIKGILPKFSNLDNQMLLKHMDRRSWIKSPDHGKQQTKVL